MTISACPICSEESSLLVNEVWAGEWQATCMHGACEQCLRQWVDTQVPRCRARRQLRIPCFESGCRKTVPQRLVLHVSSRAQHLADELERRFDLERNALYPQAAQVNCPRPGCIGLGYLGFDTVMCFVCEHQWTPALHQGDSRPCQERKCAAADGGEDLPSGVKSCPRCAVLIEKDGGCDHMTCQCGYEFWWDTLQMWEP
mmetsp:Transcript_57756/g.101148  ORF Transcript_57756/g.101148 Transcript_57756/m.101148 type:complete len:200 (+) Transcript_57756:110-709(+)